MTDDGSTSIRRGPGRPKGLPRTGGRQKGTPNQLSGELRDEIVNRYAPHSFLGRVVMGLKIRVGPAAGPGGSYAYPDLGQRLKAAELLLGKVLPDLRAHEISGAEGKPLVPESRPINDAAFMSSLVALWKQAAET